MMEVQIGIRRSNFHAYSKSFRLQELAHILRPLGMRPVFGTARKLIVEELTPLDIAVPEIFKNTSEVYTSLNTQQRTAVLARLSELGGGRGAEAALLELVVLSDSPQEVVKRISEGLKLELLEHSSEDASLINQVRTHSLVLGPNGKLLEDTLVRAAAKAFLDDNLRKCAKEIVEIFGVAQLSRKQLDELSTGWNDPASLDALISSGVLQSGFQIQCQKCNNLQLLFLERPAAEQAARSSRCACGGRDLAIVESFGITPAHQKCLKQGLWLEFLVSETVGRVACKQWSGYFADENEIDVLSVIANHLTLFECKDTSFGQNDLYVAAMKAERIGASKVVIVSTHDLHANVLQVMSAMNAGSSNRPARYITVISPLAYEIEKQIGKLLDDWSADDLRHWLRQNDGAQAWEIGRFLWHGPSRQ
jgi:hypothetical protein